MGLFKKRADPAEVERLRAEIEAMSARLAAADAAKLQLDQLDGKVAGLVTRLDTPIGPPPTEPPPAPAPAVDPREIDKINAKIERITTRLDEAPPVPEVPPGLDPAEMAEVHSMIERLSGRLEELDGRISSISTELANQITELSGDIDALGTREPPTEQVVDELRDAQTRLANEQARYQIAFRQDLADLADRLRRS
jgi:tetrahydromethanopterin S-methyltransferase subunit G